MAASAEGDQASEERIIAEQYKIWKKNTPFLYDCVLTHALDWPSLTVDWMEERVDVPGKDYCEHKMVLGTHTSQADTNHLMVATARLPREDAEIDASKYDEERGELGGYSGMAPKVEIVCRMVHDGEVNRARHCPHNGFLIATKGPSGDAFLYDYSAHPSRPKEGDTEPHPQLTLRGHTKEGYGLAWSSMQEGKLVSGSDDCKVVMWDIMGRPRRGDVLMPTAEFLEHEGVVEDVAWHHFSPHLFGSVGDDHRLILWDSRQKSSTHSIIAHQSEVNCLDFNPFMEHLLATGGADKTAALWDTRNLSGRLHSLETHKEEVFSVKWAPFNESILATSAQDRRLAVWDLSRIGREQTAEDARDGPPELLFVHGGHTGRIGDFSWNLSDDWFIASVAEDNILQMWQMGENMYLEKDEAEFREEEEAAAAAASSSSSSSSAAAARG